MTVSQDNTKLNLSYYYPEKMKESPSLNLTGKTGLQANLILSCEPPSLIEAPNLNKKKRKRILEDDPLAAKTERLLSSPLKKYRSEKTSSETFFDSFKTKSSLRTFYISLPSQEKKEMRETLAKLLSIYHDWLDENSFHKRSFFRHTLGVHDGLIAHSLHARSTGGAVTLFLNFWESKKFSKGGKAAFYFFFSKVFRLSDVFDSTYCKNGISFLVEKSPLFKAILEETSRHNHFGEIKFRKATPMATFLSLTLMKRALSYYKSNPYSLFFVSRQILEETKIPVLLFRKEKGQIVVESIEFAYDGFGFPISFDKRSYNNFKTFSNKLREPLILNDSKAKKLVSYLEPKKKIDPPRLLFLFYKQIKKDFFYDTAYPYFELFAKNTGINTTEVAHMLKNAFTTPSWVEEPLFDVNEEDPPFMSISDREEASFLRDEGVPLLNLPEVIIQNIPDPRILKFDEPVEIPKSELPKKKSKIRGLPNVGNSCYLNSAMQAFFHLKLFRKLILRDNWLLELNSLLEAEVNSFFNRMTLTLNRGEIREVLRKWQQIPSREFDQRVLDESLADHSQMRKNDRLLLKALFKSASSEKMLEQKVRELGSLYFLKENDLRPALSQLRQALFSCKIYPPTEPLKTMQDPAGILEKLLAQFGKTTTLVKKKYPIDEDRVIGEIEKQAATIIQLEAPDPNKIKEKEISLQDLIESNFSKKKLHDEDPLRIETEKELIFESKDWFEKYSLEGSDSDYLVLQLKRYYQSFETRGRNSRVSFHKIDTKFRIDDSCQLDLSTGFEKEKGSCLYQIKAVLFHEDFGLKKANTGHYSLIVRKKEAWIQLSDNKILKVNPKEFIESGYIYFLKKINF